MSVRFDVEASAAEALSDALLDAGALSVDATDPLAGTADEQTVFAEPADAAPVWWSVSRLTALFDAPTDASAVVGRAASAIGCAIPDVEISEVAEKDWVLATQAQFQPIRIADGFWIVPSWSVAPDPSAVNLSLDPGVAFGTGAHPTTRLCLAWLREHVAEGMSMIDYGCGSGILAIAAALLGAAPVAGTDIDPQAVKAARDNAAANGVDIRFTRVDALAPGRFDIVVANILANPLRVLAPALAARAAAHGNIALSGILAGQADDVVDAYSPWFAMQTASADDGWVLLTGRRRDG